MDEKIAMDVWITLLVIVGIQKKYSTKSSEWSFIVKKSEKWASEKLGASYEKWKAAAFEAF